MVFYHNQPGVALQGQKREMIEGFRVGAYTSFHGKFYPLKRENVKKLNVQLRVGGSDRLFKISGMSGGVYKKSSPQGLS
jgi:hypothetical protein